MWFKRTIPAGEDTTDEWRLCTRFGNEGLPMAYLEGVGWIDPATNPEGWVQQAGAPPIPSPETP
jgi:hypothetical protein